MNQAALHRLSKAQAALSAALDGRDVETLEAATADLAEAVGELRAAGGWRDCADLRESLNEALHFAEAVRGRINAQADRNRRQLDRLIALTDAPRPQAYSRSGRFG